MSNFIIGTAGHIDHGKSSLIRALTNIETDRFDEEQERGITIDLGFAYLDTPDGERIGIVDVPGHEKFIRNMVAGVTGIDLVLLVVAADESVMPQTKEHLDILRFLDIEEGIIVITKKDLAEEAFVELVKEDIREHTKKTFLKDAPIIQTSSETLEGIPELKEMIYEKVKQKKSEKKDAGFRMPIDRSFSLKGFGTIVTGTLIEGTLNKGDAIEVFPSNLETSARNIQVHGEDKEIAYSGQRVAINLANVDKDDLSRGDVIAPPDALIDTDLIDVEFSLIESTERIINNNTRVRLYIGTTEVMARITLLDKEVLLPGDSCLAQFRLEDNIVCRYNDKFVVRFYSPLETIGGGKILATKTAYKKRFDETHIKQLEIKQSGDKVRIIENYLFNHFFDKNSLKEIVKYTGLSQKDVETSLETLLKSDEILAIDECYFNMKSIEKMEDALVSMINEFHRENPIIIGINKEEVRQKLFNGLDKKYFDKIIEILIKSTNIIDEGTLLKLDDFEIVYNEEQKQLYDRLVAYYLENEFNPEKLNIVLDDLNFKKDDYQIFTNLVNEGTLIRLNKSIVLHQKTIQKAKDLLLAFFEENEYVTLGDFRDVLGSSRKITIPILEYFDEQGLTKRVEDKRIKNN